MLEPSLARLSLIEQRVANDAANTPVAYLLWLAGGLFGFHRFYLGRVASGLVQCLAGFVALGLYFANAPFLAIPIALWWFVDLFAVTGMLAKSREDIRARLLTEAFHAEPDAPGAPAWVKAQKTA